MLSLILVLEPRNQYASNLTDHWIRQPVATSSGSAGWQLELLDGVYDRRSDPWVITRDRQCK